MKRTLFLPVLVIGGLGSYLGCSHFSQQMQSRAIEREPAYASNERSASVPEGWKDIIRSDNPHANIEFPPGLTTVEEVADLWHLSEGSDIFPLKWFMHMRSLTTGSQTASRLSENLDSKFGLIKESEAFKDKHLYPLKWVGLTATWSDEHPTQSDAKLKFKGQPLNQSDLDLLRELEPGKKQIVMVGTNCAFCHTGRVHHPKFSDPALIEGAPNMMYIRGFFQDLAGSTVQTMLKADLLEELLRSTGYRGDAKQTAQKFSSEFLATLSGDTEFERDVQAFKSSLIDAVSEAPLIKLSSLARRKKLRAVQELLYKKRQVTERYLIQLMELTYGFAPGDVPETLKLRMKWLSVLMGADPSLPVTPEGYARTDAFGRISNGVARGDKPIPLTATVSVPPMWAIKYKSLFHWNGNTNSVLMRNVGQAFGLGAILTKDGAKCGPSNPADCESTVNLHNLTRLESLLYKLEVPNWEKSFGEDDIQWDLALRGCNTFQVTCAGCHRSQPERVGPQKKLVHHDVKPLELIGTDSTYVYNQRTPVGNVPFRTALFNFTKGVRDRYFMTNLADASSTNIEKVKSDWGRFLWRGDEQFRDTVEGQQGYSGGLSYLNVPPGRGYLPRDLAGIWATAPYLHNGSVASLHDLLTPPEKRPKIFFTGSIQYDTDKLGFVSSIDTVPDLPGAQDYIRSYLRDFRLTGARPGEIKIRTTCAMYPERCFNTELTGNSNQGHKFGTNLSPSQKRELIEFLKVLRPEPEYSWTTPPRYRVEANVCQRIVL